GKVALRPNTESFGNSRINAMTPGPNDAVNGPDHELIAFVFFQRPDIGQRFICPTWINRTPLATLDLRPGDGGKWRWVHPRGIHPKDRMSDVQHLMRIECHMNLVEHPSLSVNEFGQNLHVFLRSLNT